MTDTYLNTDKTVLLASEMTDFGEVAEKGSKAEAQKLANEERVAVTIRDPLTDTVLAVVQPKGPAPKKTAVKAATKGPAKAKASAKANAAPTHAKAASGDDNEIAADEAEQRRVRALKAADKSVSASKAERDAKAAERKAASEASKAEVAKAKAERKAAAAKPKAAPKAKTASKAPREGGPKGMVVEILKLASRADGVSPAELNTLTTWKGAPWKWLFSNPKGNGYCDRWDYSFEVVKTDAGVRYKVAKLAAASV